MKKLFGLALAFVLVAMLFAGCGGGGDNTTTAAMTTKTTTSAATATSSKPATTTSAAPTTTASGSNALEDVFAKAAGITSMYCELTMTGPDGTSQMKEWVKQGKLKMEMTVEGETVIIIFDGQNMYMYYPSENRAMKFSSETMDTYNSALDDTESLENYNPLLVGSEVVDGKDCYVFEYSADGSTTKMWIWKERGLPVRMTMTDSSGTMTMLYKNYSFNTIPDSAFQLPAGVEIIDMSSMTGIPST